MNLFETTGIPTLILLAGYLITLFTSGQVVCRIINRAKGVKNSPFKERLDTGFIIGKCENLIVLSLVLLNAFTALAIIFTAKSIVRADAIKQDPMYYLGGTLINFTYSLLMALIIRFAIDLYRQLAG